ncbi:MAG TPA: hypothetical protein VMJ10_19350 [Kofleriaceae bacterium]|nr:hypothetical protein [Kofleriaceae bacterium]
MIDDEVRTALEELVDETGAVSARIVGDDEAIRTGVPARTVPLGGGEYLRVELPTRSERGPEAERSGPRSTRGDHIEAAFERVARQLRAIRRRWEVARLPEIGVVPGASLPAGARVIDRIESYLRALAAIDAPLRRSAALRDPAKPDLSIDRATNAFVTRGTQLVAAARVPDDLEGSRWPFLARRALATHAPGSSHGEVVDPDAYAMSFWYDAVLVVLLAEPFALDFVRHRCRQVARELCNLLPLLEPDPEAPAAVGPRPRSPTQP